MKKTVNFDLINIFKILLISFLLCVTINTSKAEVAFSFDEVNLVSAINILSPEIGETIIIDDNINENLSLIIQHPVNKKKIISALQTALNSKGLALVELSNGNLIITNNLNLEKSVPVAKKDRVGVQLFILPLKNIKPEIMVPFISQYFPEKNLISSSPNNRSISFIGNKDDFKRFESLIRKFDFKPKKIIDRIKLKHTEAKEISSILQSLLESGNWLVGPTNDVNITYTEKSNSIIISAPKNSLDQIKSLIFDLDVAEPKKQVKDILTKDTQEIKSSAKQPAQKAKNNFGFEVLFLKNASANEIETTINEVLLNSNFSLSDDNSSGKISIKAYMSGNQIIISGSEPYRTELIKLIKTLDVPIKQVYVEAIVAEVSNSAARELGLQFSGSSGKAGLTILNSNSLGANIGSQVTGFVSDGIGVTLGPAAKQISNLGALVNIIENDGNSEILATPTLLAMNNKQAEILVGSNIPVITGKYTSSSESSSATPFQTISREDVGVILKVTPIIGADGMITIEIVQEVSELDTSSAIASDIVTTKRAIKTSAVVKTGETLAVGGLINESTQFLGSKIPILGDIPGLKELFNQRRMSVTKRNLVIFLKPTIVNETSVSEYTVEKFLKLKEQSEIARKNNSFKLKYPPLPFIENLQ